MSDEDPDRELTHDEIPSAFVGHVAPYLSKTIGEAGVEVRATVAFVLYQAEDESLAAAIAVDGTGDIRDIRRKLIVAFDEAVHRFDQGDYQTGAPSGG